MSLEKIAASVKKRGEIVLVLRVQGTRQYVFRRHLLGKKKKKTYAAGVFDLVDNIITVESGEAFPIKNKHRSCKTNMANSENCFTLSDHSVLGMQVPGPGCSKGG